MQTSAMWWARARMSVWSQPTAILGPPALWPGAPRFLPGALAGSLEATRFDGPTLTYLGAAEGQAATLVPESRVGFPSQSWTGVDMGDTREVGALTVRPLAAISDSVRVAGVVSRLRALLSCSITASISLRTSAPVWNW